MFILPVTAVLLSLLLYIPLFGQMARYYNSAGHLVAGKWLDLKFLGDLVKIFSGSHYPAAGIIICLAGLPGLHRLYKSQNRLFWLYGLPIFFIILSTLTLHLFIYARFLAFAMPLFAMALACSLDFLSEPASLKIKRININIFPAAGLILISVLLAFSLSRYYRLEKQGFKKAGLYIQEKYPGVPVISYGAASVLFKLYIPPAEGFSRKQSLEPEDLTGKLVVGSFPASWSEHSRQILTRYCRLEEVWPGAGEEDDTVYLYNCLGKGSRGGSE